jgi:hypothetical protein
MGRSVRTNPCDPQGQPHHALLFWVVASPAPGLHLQVLHWLCGELDAAPTGTRPTWVNLRQRDRGPARVRRVRPVRHSRHLGVCGGKDTEYGACSSNHGCRRKLVTKCRTRPRARCGRLCAQNCPAGWTRARAAIRSVTRHALESWARENNKSLPTFEPTDAVIQASQSCHAACLVTLRGELGRRV